MAKKSRLDSISVPKPCTESWNEMNGGEKSRFCGICEKNVYNISAMTQREANKLLFDSGEKVCIRMEKDAHGKVKTLKNQLHQITRQAPIAAGVLSATLAFSAATLAQGKPIRINSDKVNIVKTAKDESSKPAISGTIYDELGAVIPNVNVILRNVRDNSIQKTVSNGDGVYLFSYIEPSVYEIETDGVVGFKEFTAKNIEVSGKNNLQLNMILQVNLSELMGDIVIISTESPETNANKIVQLEKSVSSKPAISGTIRDVEGGIVPKVEITLRDVKNNSSQNVTSSLEGKYHFDNLKSSTYQIDFEADGFKKSVFENIKTGENNLVLNVVLEAGEIMGVFAESNTLEIEGYSAKIEEKINFIEVKEVPPSGKIVLGLPLSSINKSSNQTSRISFTVVDIADAMILGAEVVLTNQKTKQKFVNSSNKDGIVEFKEVPVGKYKILISADGFKSEKFSLSVDEKTTFNKKMVLDFAGDVRIGMYIDSDQ